MGHKSAEENIVVRFLHKKLFAPFLMKPFLPGALQPRGLFYHMRPLLAISVGSVFKLKKKQTVFWTVCGIFAGEEEKDTFQILLLLLKTIKI